LDKEAIAIVILKLFIGSVEEKVKSYSTHSILYILYPFTTSLESCFIPSYFLVDTNLGLNDLLFNIYLFNYLLFVFNYLLLLIIYLFIYLFFYLFIY